MTIGGFRRRRSNDPAKSDKTESKKLHRDNCLTAVLTFCACSSPVIVVSISLGGGGADDAPPGIMEFGSSTKPPPGNGTGVNPGMTGGALHAAGPNAN